jgi:tetratricopeptide (TPR) repeat protein
MLRMALIASLIVLNLSVWMGPAEVLAARGKALIDPAPRYDRAQQYAYKGDVKSALAEFEALIEAEPKNANYRAEYALLCYNESELLVGTLGRNRGELIATVQKEMKAARDLSPREYSASAQYALALMDEEFFGTELPVEVIVEAWSHTIALVRELREQTPGWADYDTAIAHACLQLARAEHRYGRDAEVEKYLRQALDIEPTLRVPGDLIAS